MYRRILMPTDGSSCSEQAIGQGLELAARLGARVTFLFVLEDPFVAYPAPDAIGYLPQLYDDLRKAGEEALERARALADEAGVEAEIRLLEDRDPVKAIHEAEADHDLVVMGTHGRRGVNRWMFGSVAEGALRRSEKPFLVIRSQPDEEGEGETP